MEKSVGVVCGFLFFDSLHVQKIRSQLELEFGFKVKLVRRSEALALGKHWSKEFSNTLFIYTTDKKNFYESVGNGKLTKFLEKYKLYTLCFYERGQFTHFDATRCLLEGCTKQQALMVSFQPCIGILKALILFQLKPLMVLSKVVTKFEELKLNKK